MSKIVQVRNVPDAVHRKLEVRAAESGRSLSEFLLEKLTQLAELPTIEEMARRLETRTPVKSRMSAAAAVRKERGSA